MQGNSIDSPVCLSVRLSVCLSVCLSVPNFCPRFLSQKMLSALQLKNKNSVYIWSSKGEIAWIFLLFLVVFSSILLTIMISIVFKIFQFFLLQNYKWVHTHFQKISMASKSFSFLNMIFKILYDLLLWFSSVIDYLIIDLSQLILCDSTLTLFCKFVFENLQHSLDLQ